MGSFGGEGGGEGRERKEGGRGDMPPPMSVLMPMALRLVQADGSRARPRQELGKQAKGEEKGDGNKVGNGEGKRDWAGS